MRQEADAVDLGERVEARPQRLHEEQVLLLSELEEILEFWRVGSSGLFAKNVLARKQGIPSVLVMQGVRSTDVDGLNILKNHVGDA